MNVRGIFTQGTGKPYAGCYYDTVRDQFSDQELGIKIPTMIRESLVDGNLVDFSGIIERRLNQKGYIQLTLAVTRVDVVLESKETMGF